jgi:23S rRNA pseudouridine1911/1915/1917 synthase
MEFKIIYEDENLLVIEKPAGITVFPEGTIKEKTLIDYLLERYPFLRESGSAPRYGIIHRLDKETSGILLVAKNNLSLNFLQKQFKERRVIKKYLALLIGELKEEKGIIKTLIGRSPKNRNKQKVYLSFEPASRGKREAITKYETLKKFNGYTLVEVIPKTGRKHQIRAHFAYLNHPIAGDKLYGFKNQPKPADLKRQFLHGSYLKIKLLNNKTTEFKSDLPEDLKNVIKDL